MYIERGEGLQNSEYVAGGAINKETNFSRWIEQEYLSKLSSYNEILSKLGLERIEGEDGNVINEGFLNLGHSQGSGLAYSLLQDFNQRIQSYNMYAKIMAKPELISYDTQMKYQQKIKNFDAKLYDKKLYNMVDRASDEEVSKDQKNALKELLAEIISHYQEKQIVYDNSQEENI